MATPAKTIIGNADETAQMGLANREHLAAEFIGDPQGPTLIVIGGIHGNEAAGVKAIDRVSERLRSLEDRLSGRVFLLVGNTRALGFGRRFLDRDLNRSWKLDVIAAAHRREDSATAEECELVELDGLLDRILITARSEVYVVDMHSTSADGVPFATVGDTLRNRAFARRFPVTILLGIEEHLEGTLLEYLNNAGAVTLGFEGGQHDSPRTVSNHEALIWLSLMNAGLLQSSDLPDLHAFRRSLALAGMGPMVFEVRHRHPVREDDGFEMDAGYENFQPISKGDVLADDRNGHIHAKEGGVILMPLYQTLGEDGFFIGRSVATFWLYLSAWLRRLGVQKLMSLLPGVRRDPYDSNTLIVDTSVARLFPLQVFHLLGFRRRRWVNGELVVSRRRHDVISPFIGGTYGR